MTGNKIPEEFDSNKIKATRTASPEDSIAWMSLSKI
jgi:hypothetical protein